MIVTLYKYNMRHLKQRLILFAIVAIFVTMLTIVVKSNSNEIASLFQGNKETNESVSCYETSDDTLLDIEKANVTEKSIIFIETSCKGGLNSRQACSVESAALKNPDWTVIVVFVAPVTELELNKTHMRRLLDLNNVQFVRINVTSFANGTPVESFFTAKYLGDSAYPVAHTADVLRLLILNRYGGLYLDLDMMVIRSFNTLPKNFCSKESEQRVVNGVLGFEKEGVGKIITERCLRALLPTYKPKSWNSIGPMLLLSVLQDFCTTRDVSMMTPETCHGLTVLDSKYFVPVHYTNNNFYFEDSPVELKDEYTHHFSNFLTSKRKVTDGSVYAQLSRTFCPEIYKTFGDNFGS